MTNARIRVFNQVMAGVDAQARSCVVRRVVFVRAPSGWGTPLLILPFVLRGYANCASFLFNVAIVPPRVVHRIVLVVFRSSNGVNERGRAFVGAVSVLQSYSPNGVHNHTVHVRVLSSAVVAITSYVLYEDVCARPLFLVQERVVGFHSPTVSDVLRLFNCVHFVKESIRFVPTAARLARVVVFGDRF